MCRTVRLGVGCGPLAPLRRRGCSRQGSNVNHGSSSGEGPSFQGSGRHPTPGPQVTSGIHGSMRIASDVSLPSLPRPVTQARTSRPRTRSRPGAQVQDASSVSAAVSNTSLSSTLGTNITITDNTITPRSTSSSSRVANGVGVRRVLTG